MASVPGQTARSRSQSAGDTGEPENISLRNLFRFMRFSLPYWPWLAGGVVTGLMRMGLGLFMPLFMKYVIDEVGNPYIDGAISSTEAWTRMAWIGGALFAVILASGVGTMGRFYCPHRAAASAIRDIRTQLFSHLQRLSLGFHQQRPTGGIVARLVSDVNAGQQAFDLIMVQFLQQILKAVVILCVLFWVDWQWALVAIATTPLFLITTRTLRRPMRKATRRQRESMERISGLTQERLAMIREVQSFTNEPHEDQQVYDEAEELRRHTLRQRLLAGLMKAASQTTQFTGLAIVVTFGLYRITSGGGEATVGDLPLFFMYTQQILAPMQFFADLYTRMHMSAAAADRVFDFLDAEPDIKDHPDARPLKLDHVPTITFDRVTFSYPSDNPVVALNDVSLTVPPASKVVLVGESGSGKSTLMSLLPRFYDVQEGRILIDDTDIRDLKLRSLRQHIGIVPQEPVLFTGTIKENILYGKPDATDEGVFQATRDANADGFIRELEGGYDEEVGERGVGLSGGQIQRIAIARAFLRDPEILIMDEPTSNLDATSETLVCEALDRLGHGRTTFIIAHRLSVARDAHLVVVLGHGGIVEQGTHEELLLRGGAYYDLWVRQVGVPAESAVGAQP